VESGDSSEEPSGDSSWELFGSEILSEVELRSDLESEGSLSFSIGKLTHDTIVSKMTITDIINVKIFTFMA
jgi:hypothetical protein